MGRLSGKGAVVTGGTGGIGEAIATAFAKEGAAVAIVDLDQAAANAATADIDEAMIDKLFGVNIKGVILTTKAFAQHLTGIGKAGTDTNIINRARGAGRKGWPELKVYSASKAAVMAFSRVLAVELAPYARTNTIYPGYIRNAGILWQNRAAESDAAGEARGKPQAVQSMCRAAW